MRMVKCTEPGGVRAGQPAGDRCIFPAMPALFRTPRLRLALVSLTAIAGCRAAPPEPSTPPPPPAEFVLSAGDSSFWVSSAAGKLRLRGAPLELARVDGRFYELYVTDDDRSFSDAILIGQRVYRRDLVTGDSLLVYQDTIIPRLAKLYQRLHPNDEPLAPNDEPSSEPLWTAMSTLDLGEVAGPFVSYTLHTDVERDDAPLWHTSRRGVLDIRTGRIATLALVAGRARRDVERRRAFVLRSTLDSVRASHDLRGARAAAMLPYYRLDPASFSLTTVDGVPAVAYALPGAGDGDAGHLLALAPIPIGEPVWWPDVAAGLPVSSADGARDVWRRGSYEVVVRYGSFNGAGQLSLRDSTSREWLLGRVPSPASRILWLDRPPLDSASRHALDRAFRESSLYDDAVRTVAYHRTPPRRAARHLSTPARARARHRTLSSRPHRA